MMHRFLKWLGNRLFPGNAAVEAAPRQAKVTVRRRPVVKAVPRVKPVEPPEDDARMVEFESDLGGRIEDGGPGKNVLIRNKYLREDTGTHETLKILDDSLLESQDEEGIDPYNTGRFDRSKFWVVRQRK